MILRPYQQRAHDAIYDYFRDGGTGNPLVALPTASGKSVVIAKFAEGAIRDWSTTRIVCCTHVKELIEQNYAKMLDAWPEAPAGIYSASVGRREARAQILFAGIQTVFNKAHEIGFVDLLLIDECHLLPESSDSQYRAFIDALMRYNPALKVIGFTATPYRQGQGMLTEGKHALFHKIVIDLTQGEELVALIDAGYLAPLHPKNTDAHFNLAGVRVTGGDFNARDLERAADQITQAATLEALALGEQRRSRLWFCAGVDHAIATRDLMRSLGYPCEVVSNRTPKGERERILADFKAGRLRDVTNANVLTTGFDHPALDMIVLLRPTRSASLHVQMLGRGMRICIGKFDCLVLDFAGNIVRLGPINAIRIPKPRGKNAGGVVPTKVCPKCKEIVAAAARLCAGCGFEFPEPKPDIAATAGIEKIIVRKEDLITQWTVDNVRYAMHAPPGKKPMLKVTYECGQRDFHEWVPIGWPKFMGSEGANWWMRRSDSLAPSSVDRALSRQNELRKPLRIRVDNNGKYPKVIHHAFH